MALKIQWGGGDWYPPAASTATIQRLMQTQGWYCEPVASTPSSGMSLVTGVYGYGLGLEYNLALTPLGQAQHVWLKPIGALNSVGGFISAGLRLETNNSAAVVMGVYDAVANIQQISVGFCPNGVVKCWRGDPINGTQIGVSRAGVFDYQTDFDVEIFCTVHGSVGEVEVRIDTVTVMHLINQNTKPGTNAYFDSVMWGIGFAAPVFAHFRIDNFRYYDTTGAVNNTWLGTSRTQTSIVAGNGTTTDFTRSNTGLANWQNLLNNNVDDTLFLFDPTVGDLNLSTIVPLVNSPTVFGVEVTVLARQDDATQRFIQTAIVSGGVQANGAAFPTTQTYSADSDVFELDPNTGLGFTGAAVNALQIGVLIYS